MQLDNECRSITYKLKLLAIGMMSGFVSGFLGAGGGVVLIVCASISMKGRGIREIFAQTSLITAAFSIVSAIMYYKHGDLPVKSSLPLLLPSALGGALGAFILDKIKVRTLKLIFGIISALAGTFMILR